MEAELWSCERYDREAQRLSEAGEYDAAVRLLGEAVGLYPGSPELRVSIGYAHLASEDYAWARRAFDNALALEPDNEDALAGLGQVLLKFGERQRAYRLFDRLLELGFGDDAELMLMAGRALSGEGLYQRAEIFFRRAVDADSDSPDAAAEVAWMRQARGDPDGARAWFERALELDASMVDTRARLAHLHYEQGRFGEALAEFERIPPPEMWEALTAWRTIELLRAYGGLSIDSPRLDPYLARLEELSGDASPEEELLAEIEAGGASPGGARNQLDLFGPARAAEDDDVL